MADNSPRGILLRLFDSKTVVDLPAICEALGGKSAMTAFRHLRGLPYRRSYNHNGAFYARHLPERYDRLGLWSHGDIHFSVDGSLGATVRRLVHEAGAGATQRELQERLGLRVHNAVLALVRATEVHRDAVDGVYAYFHTDPLVREAQLERRRGDAAKADDDSADVNDGVVIRVLLVLIRYPGSGAADVVRHLRGHAPPISIQQVQAVFTRFELGEKKGPLNC